MALTEEQAAKIILIRSIEEADKGVFSEQMLADALLSARDEPAGLEWIEKRASYLFEHLSTWHQSIVQLAKAPANWTVPVCLLALILGIATNLLGPTEKIHVVRNPVFFLVAWNLMAYLALLLLFLRNRARRNEVFAGRFGRGMQADAAAPARITETHSRVSWMVQYLVPRMWQFLHKIMFGFHQGRNLAHLTSRFSAHWFSIAGTLVAARWRYLLHWAALSLAIGATLGMYFRGLFHGYEFVWASMFITDERTVANFIDVVFGPAFLISNLLMLGLSERIDIGGLLTPEGDPSAAWIHLFAIMVVLTVVIPRTVLALSLLGRIRRLAKGFGLSLDRYYGDIIESPIRSIIDKETNAAIAELATKVAAYVGSALYDQQIVPRLGYFRQNGGKISALKTDLTELTESFLPKVKAFIVDSAIPEFKSSLSRRVGEILKSIGTDFVNRGDPEAILHDLRIHPPGSAEAGVSDQFSRAIGVSVGAAISLVFAAVAGGIGEELGIAILAAVLGTTGPVGFVIGLIIGGLVAAGAWWFGKEKITQTVDQVNLPAWLVRAALWESRFNKLIDDGRKQCEESVKTNVAERLTPLLPRITDEIMFRIRSLWGKLPEPSVR
jgi:hypothetical protein